MSRELTASFSLTLNKSGQVLSRMYSTQGDVLQRPYAADAIAVDSTGRNLPKGDVSTIGWMAVKNANDTGGEAVHVGMSGTILPFRLQPGEWCEGPWNWDQVYAKADISSASIEYALLSR